MRDNRVNDWVFWAVVVLALAYLIYAIGMGHGFEEGKEFKTKNFNLEIDRCIRDEIVFYGDLIGEDPDQTPRNIVRQTGRAIKECIKERL